MPTNPVATFTMIPGVEKRDSGWVVLHYNGSGWIIDQFTAEDEARSRATETANRMCASNEFILVFPVSEVYCTF
jgi:hypothetical protein